MIHEQIKVEEELSPEEIKKVAEYFWKREVLKNGDVEVSIDDFDEMPRVLYKGDTLAILKETEIEGYDADIIFSLRAHETQEARNILESIGVEIRKEKDGKYFFISEGFNFEIYPNDKYIYNPPDYLYDYYTKELLAESEEEDY